MDDLQRSTTPMTKGEREELRNLLKRREHVAKSHIEQRAAEVMADAEQQLATKYKVDDAAWAELTAAAGQAVADADAALAERCRVLGIPADFRPRIACSWHSRGENADNQRRAELRKVAQTRIAAMTKAARVAIETQTLDGLTLLTRAALASEDAQRFLAGMPTVETLLPALDVGALDPLALVAGSPHDD